ncbi:hypothetical protein NODU109028_00700 [Nocardioides dubius]|uniref:Uncharacterized protein n=1 Tax=Nocardioides dubius TaxID=317019 RepID=A0ABP4ELP4_9ACTN
MSGSHPALPRATFQGYWMAPGAFGGVPVWLSVEGGLLSLVAAQPGSSGTSVVFRVPVQHARVRAAAQRITVTVAGRTYPVLARPLGPVVGPAVGVAGSLAGLAGAERVHGGAVAARGANVAADAAAFSRQGGHQLLAALRASGAPVRRVGYPAILAAGLAAGFLVVLLVTVITVVALR